MSEVKNRVVQEDLVNPTLLVLASIEKLYDNYNLKYDGVYSTIVREAVISSIEPMLSEEDKAKLKGRNDTKIDQTFRNLISHNVLKNRCLVSFNENGSMRLTEDGYKELVDYFNKRYESRNLVGLESKESYKSTLYNAFNNGKVPFKSAKVEELHESIKEIIRKRTMKEEAAKELVKNETVANEEKKAKPKRILKMGS